MILRPHHLLCTQSYEGRGYSAEFIKNMDKNIEILKNKQGFKIKIECGLDDLCVACPHNKGQACSSEVKVKNMDEKVLKYFNLKEEFYVYKDVINLVQRKITSDILADICKECEWYEYGMCKKIILKKH